ncbi:hypothetical protein RDWZM_000157 [Blomia tropicalis]|uniref:BZIP domain-containing protein n=1 Tax=Blomia tropicalis TaxID=40697 RepID=A0A9Q0MCA9_BLOTA|nr:hypothetical protein RDWZM_000157 [Blomia tropicalis]
MHSSSSSPPPPPPPLASSTASTHYELPYRSLIERQRIVHEMQSNPSSCWKSWSDLEPSSSTQFGMIPHVPPPPPAHHNPTSATINRFLPTSTGYSVPSSLVSPTQSNSTNFLSSSSIAHDTQPTSGRTGNKSSSLTSGRRSNNNGTNRIPSAMKDTTEYKIKRERNNIAVRKSREKAKKRLRENENRANELMADNAQLRNRINILSSVLHGYRMLLHNYGKSQDEINSVLRKTLGSAAYEAIDQDSIINQLGHIDHHHHHHSHPHGLMSPNISGLPETLFCKSSSTIDSAHFTELHSQQQQQQQSSEGVLQHQEYGQHQEQSNLLQLQQQQQMH